jgi:hypothetical protein
VKYVRGHSKPATEPAGKSRSKRVSGSNKSGTKTGTTAKKTRHRDPGQRDPRLPKVGATITREYKGKQYLVRCLDAGFEYKGKLYKSLSRVAMEITGAKAINGYLFFECALCTPRTTSSK